MEPRTYAWLVPGRLAVAERPGGGGRSHRITRREAELAWWRDQGVRVVVSGMGTRHGLVEAALAGFAVRWFPIPDDDGAPAALAVLATGVQELMADADGAVLVHCNRPGEWLAAVDGALRLRLGLAADVPEALEHVERDGLPVGSITVGLVSAIGEGLQSPEAVTL
jgi:hypothetical protein